MLLLAAALFYASRADERASASPGRAPLTQPQQSTEENTWDALKSQEFLVDAVAPSADYAAIQVPGNFSRNAGKVSSGAPKRAKQYHQARPNNADSLFVPAPGKQAPSGKQNQAAASRVATGNAYSSSSGHGPVGRGYALGGGSHENSARRKEGKTPTAFAPYLSAYTKKQAEKLEKKLAKLPGLIDAAIARAFLPKSKKDMNIEKYLSHREGGQPAADSAGVSKNPFAAVNKQFSRQKTSIVNAMKKAYGDKAATRAGRLMDAYQKEISQALSQPGLTPEQIQQKTTQISNKYNERLEKLNKQSAQEYAEKVLSEQTQSLQNDLSDVYGDELSGKLGEISATYDQKALELSQAGLPEEEYRQQYLDNEYQRRKALEKAITENGQSVKGFRNWEEKQAQKRIEEREKAEEEGTQTPTVYRASSDELSQNYEKDLAKAREAFGDETAGRLDQVHRQYEQAKQEIENDEELSGLEKDKKIAELMRQTNRQYEQIQTQAAVDKNVERGLSDLKQNPATAHVPDEPARAILQEMYQAIFQAEDDVSLAPAQREQKKKQAQDSANKKLLELLEESRATQE